MVQSNGFLRCGELAEATGVSPDTVRHYEKIGVLPKADRTPSGYRLYRKDAVGRVIIVQRALRIGFTLSELSDIFKSRDAGGTPCKRVFELANQKLKEIDGDIEALSKTRRHLVGVLAEWEIRMKKSGPGQRSHLLQSLTGAISSPKRSKRFRRQRT